jgi:hypothetical protein
VKEIEPVMVQIAMALSHAHRHTVHGDLKPENVLILPDVLKLTDFSAWEAVEPAVFVKAQQEADMGAYLAPEMVAGGAVDLRADIYSLGAIFYELLTGRTFGPGAPPPSEVLAQADESGPEGIDGFVTRSTAPDPRDRYETAEAFIEALATYIDGRELRSVDIRAPKSLLPEDVTRRVQAPAGLQDDDSVDIETPEMDAERSLVDELDDADLEVEASMDRSVERSVERSSERSAEKSSERSGRGTPARGTPPTDVPEAPTRPWEAVQKPLTAEATVDVRQGTAVTAAQAPAPWFVRSNVGFVAAVFLIVLGVAAGAWFVVRNAQKDRPVATKTLEIKVQADATVVAQKPAAVVEARPVAPETSAPVTAAPATEPPQVIASAAPASRVAVVATPPSPATQAPAPATKAPAPATQAPPPAPATKAEAPATQAPAPATQAPVVAAAKPAPEEPPPPAKPAATNEKTSCPGGTILVTTAPFPKGSVKGRDVTGAEGVALARSGKAFCVDAYEYPGSGRPPKTSVTFEAAGGLCKAAGKRLCADSEWQRACRGGGDFPYGKTFDATRCNTEDAEGEARSITESGKFGKCRSAIGALDMSGNVAEWTADQTVRGGDYTSADEDAACSAGGKRAAGSARPTIGFRCCADLP